jgi:RHS repeat-associated protein
MNCWISPVSRRRTSSRSAIDNSGNSFITYHSPRTRSEYDAAGQKTAEIDVYGQRTEFRYDQAGRLIETRHPGGRISRTVYDQAGRSVVALANYVVGQEPLATRNIYDTAGRVIRTERVQGLQISLSTLAGFPATHIAHHGTVLTSTQSLYNSFGQLAETRSETGVVTRYEYDLAGRQTATLITADGVTTRSETAYDSRGQRTLTRDPLGRETRYEYDAAGQLTKTIFADGTFITTSYDLQGRRIAETDQLGQAKNFSYDTLNNLASVTLPTVRDAKPTSPTYNQHVRPTYQYTYDVHGNQTALLDPQGRETKWTFDSFGRQATRTLPLGQKEEFFYNDLGQERLHISFEGRVKETIYITTGVNVGRMEEERYFETVVAYNNGAGTPNERTTYAYDSIGNLTNTIQYDNHGNLRSEQRTYNAESQITSITTPEGIIRYEYDLHGSITRMTFGGSTGVANDVRYTYDSLHRLKTVEVWKRDQATIATKEITKYDYDKLSNLDLETQSNGIIVDYVYDQLGRLDDMIHYSPDSSPEILANNPVLAKFDYTLRADGKRIREVQTRQNTFSGSFDWEYDASGRLTRETYNDPGTVLDYDARYEFDLSSNRVKKSVDQRNNGSIDEVISSLFDHNDRLQLESHANGGGVVNKTIEHNWGASESATYETENIERNSAGQLLQRTSYDYNLQGSMSRALIENYSGGIFRGSSESKFAYDPHHIRVNSELIERNAANSITNHRKTKHLVEAQNHTGYQQVIEEITNDSGSSIKLAHKVFTVGLDLISQANLMNGKVHTFLYDAHGSVRALTGTTAQTVTENGINQVFTYDAFGVAINFDPTQAITNILYSGEVWEQSIGLQYLRARWMRPVSGGFTSFDPFFGNHHDPLSFHKYLYTHANPIMGIDPSGLYTSLGGALSSIGMTLATQAMNASRVSIGITAVSTVLNSAAYTYQGKGMVRGGIYGFKQGVVLSALYARWQLKDTKYVADTMSNAIAGGVSGMLGMLIANIIPQLPFSGPKPTLDGFVRDLSTRDLGIAFYEGSINAAWGHVIGDLLGDEEQDEFFYQAEALLQGTFAFITEAPEQFMAWHSGEKKGVHAFEDGVIEILKAIANSRAIDYVLANRFHLEDQFIRDMARNALVAIIEGEGRGLLRSLSFFA